MRSPKTTAAADGIYCKTKTDYVYKLCVQDFATGKNFSFIQYPKQRVLLFSRERYFQEKQKKTFFDSCVCMA